MTDAQTAATKLSTLSEGPAKDLVAKIMELIEGAQSMDEAWSKSDEFVSPAVVKELPVEAQSVLRTAFDELRHTLQAEGKILNSDPSTAVELCVLLPGGLWPVPREVIDRVRNLPDVLQAYAQSLNIWLHVPADKAEAVAKGLCGIDALCVDPGVAHVWRCISPATLPAHELHSVAA